jgi:hypothetical protein
LLDVGQEELGQAVQELRIKVRLYYRIHEGVLKAPDAPGQLEQTPSSPDDAETIGMGFHDLASRLLEGGVQKAVRGREIIVVEGGLLQGRPFQVPGTTVKPPKAAKGVSLVDVIDRFMLDGIDTADVYHVGNQSLPPCRAAVVVV